jgi:ubiquinone/menaquinone biosynthesis C-methylase UbiE
LKGWAEVGIAKCNATGRRHRTFFRPDAVIEKELTRTRAFDYAVIIVAEYEIPLNPKKELENRMQSNEKPRSIATSGRTLDHAALVYDFCEPILMLGKQAEYDHQIISVIDPSPEQRVLDLGCGMLTRAIADRLDADRGGLAAGIDAAAKMIQVARKKRGNAACRFDIAAAESLPYDDLSFDAVVSSLFFHHVDMDLKQRSLREAFRVLKPGGKLVVADMHVPTTFGGAVISHAARWFFLQPQIQENIRGVLPLLMESSGFAPPLQVRNYFGYITVFSTHKTRGPVDDAFAGISGTQHPK